MYFKSYVLHAMLLAGEKDRRIPSEAEIKTYSSFAFTNGKYQLEITN